MRLAIVLSALMVSKLALASVPGNTNLKLVDIKKEDEIHLSFDGRMDASRVGIEYINNIIQLTFNSVSVYPARISSLPEGSISKVFIYQYSPKVVRARFTLRGNAEEFKSRLKLNFNDRSIHIRIMPAASLEAVKAQAQALQAPLPKVRVESVVVAPPVPVEPTTPLQVDLEKPIVISAQSAHLGGAKPLPSFKGVFLKLGIVVLLVGLFALLIRVFGRPKPNFGWLNTVRRIAGAGFNQSEQMIEVVSTQFLGPKKSISVVKVAGRILVLGLTQESIQLITEIPEEEYGGNSDAVAKVGRATGDFSDILNDEAINGPGLGTSPAPVVQGARSRIRSRLAGLKPL